MSAYVIVDITIHDAAAYDRYKTMVPATIAAYDGEYVVRGGPVTTLEGTWTPGRFAVVRFPSVARAREWWSSPEYAPAKALRHSASTADMIVVEGVA